MSTTVPTKIAPASFKLEQGTGADPIHEHAEVEDELTVR